MKRRSRDEDDEACGGEALPRVVGRSRPPLLAPGTWFLRRFRVERLLGQGGMGAVYAVKDKGQTWALKIVRSEFLDDPGQRRRLLREGEVLARMRHPNVVQVHEVGLADDLTAWYRMELLDGVTLREELRRRGALSLPLACATVRAAALGAGHLHAFGGVHRDIKPENLFILREPRDVKLLDFGLARLSGTPDTLDAQTHGSPLFMAPEQIRDEVPTPATDVYALGLIAYEAIAGFHPFGDARAAGRIDALFARHLNDVPPPLSRIGVPEPISEVIARAIAKVPRERHRDGVAFAETLWGAFLATRGAPSARDTNPGEPEMSEVLRWGNEKVAAATGPSAAERPRGRVEGARVAAAALSGPPGGAGPRDPLDGGHPAGGDADPGQAGVGWAMTERLPERLRDPSCVAALAQRAPDPPPEQAAAAWVPVENTVPLARAAMGAGTLRAGAGPAAEGSRAGAALPAGSSHAGAGRAAAAAAPVAARPAAPSAPGAAGVRPRAWVTLRTAAIGLSLGALVSLLLLDVILRLQDASPAVPAPAQAASAPASAQPPASAAMAAGSEPPAATSAAEAASAGRPAGASSASARAEEPPVAGAAGAQGSERGSATAPAPVAATPGSAPAMPAPASSTIAPAVAPAAPPPVAKPKRRRVVRDPHFYDEFLE
ncbi:serine/threonine-protein kinase [Sorangium sp. So ce295]|uniref:serine/threonine-protein kinase n=1 Tax=Sorangium sp. So ce295 TaxID=3133295 RepID=UPI003F5F2EB1